MIALPALAMRLIAKPVQVFCLLLLQIAVRGQAVPYEISGTISGNYAGKIYLFFEDQFRQRDSISAEIRDGRFSFRGQVRMPILARLHLGQESLIGDFYLDRGNVSLTCSNSIGLMKRDPAPPDTLNKLFITGIGGASMEPLKRGFEKWLTDLEASGKPEEEIAEAHFTRLRELVKDNPKSLVSAYLVSKTFYLGYSRVKELAGLLDPSTDSTYESKSVAKLVNALYKESRSGAGAAFHDMALMNLSGKMTDTRQFRGKFLLVHFWASWCAPCRAENPALKAFYEQHKGKDFEILGISQDKDKVKWRQAIVKDGLSWPQVIEPAEKARQLSDFYAIDAIPASILLDRNGKILGRGLSDKEIEQALRSK